MYLSNAGILMSLICCIVYTIIIYEACVFLRYYSINIGTLRDFFVYMFMPVIFFNIPSVSSSYNELINLMKTINPYIFVLFLILWGLMLIKYIYLQFKNK